MRYWQEPEITGISKIYNDFSFKLPLNSKSLVTAALFFIFALIFCNRTLANENINLELMRLNKCYTLLTKSPLAQTHPLWQSVKDGNQSGTSACMEIFNKARLNNNGYLIDQGTEAKAILSTITQWHINFLNFDNDYHFTSSNTYDVIDRLGPIHYLSRALLQEVPFSESVTLNYGLLAKRDSEVTRVYSVLPRKRSNTANGAEIDYKMKFWQGSPANNEPNFNPPLVETGRLYAITHDQSPLILQNGQGHGIDNGAGKNMKHHFGGGLLGSQAFLLSHIPKWKFRSDGAINVHRLLGKSILEDVLCRSGPYVRSVDVLNEINLNSSIDFRRGIACMTCHIGQDNLAALTRNLFVIGSNNLRYVSRYGVRFVADTQDQKLPTTPLPKQEANPDFYKTQASGKLVFRGFNGKLINIPVENLQQLGEAIASTDDYYACTVKKYYKILTGIDVNLDDLGDLNSPALTAEATEYRNKVIQLALKLKETQNARLIIQDIINSMEFIMLPQQEAQ